MIVGSLFSGIGGFDLAARWMGWRTAWVSEIDPYACAVLAHHFPEARNLGDIRQVDWTTVEPVDVLVGGFPCQPASMAGKRKGIEDDRWLWSECARALAALRPRWALFENVRGLLSVNGGAAFAEVLGDLGDLGYDCQWQVVSAADVGAPHRRERVWILAWRDGPADDDDQGVVHAADEGRVRAQAAVNVREPSEGDANVGDAHEPRSQGHGQPGERVCELPARSSGSEVGGWWADAVPVRGADGTVRLIPADAAAVADSAVAGRHRTTQLENHGEDRPRGRRHDAADRSDPVAGQGAACGPESSLWPVAHGVPHRVAQLRAVGNAVVPAVVYGWFQVIAAQNARSG